MTIRETEAELCGQLLRDNTLIAEAIAIGVRPQHFDDPFLAEVFGVCCRAWERQEAVDAHAVAAQLGRGHLTRLEGIRAHAPAFVTFAPYAQALVDQRRCQGLHSRLTEISQAILSRYPMAPIDGILRQIGNLMAFSEGENASLRTTSISDALKRALTDTEARMVSAVNGKPPGVPTGFPTVDACMHGFQRGFMYVLGARTGRGKTTMATTLAVNAARAGHKVGFVTVEMSDADVADKMLLRMAKVASPRYLSGEIGDEELDRIMLAGGELDKLPILVVDVARPSFNDLALEIMRLVRVEKVELVIVDYLQIFEVGDGRNRPSREEAKQVSARIKSLCRSLNVPILVLSQLNRVAPEQGEPELIHIAETDQIARDADIVFFLYRDDRDEPYLSVAKHRRGQCMTLRLSARFEYSLFEEAQHGY